MLRVDRAFPALPGLGGANQAFLEIVEREWERFKSKTQSQSQSQSIQPLCGSWAIKKVENFETEKKALAPREAPDAESSRPKNIRAGDKRNVKFTLEAENGDSLDSGLGEQSKKFQRDEEPDVAKKSKGKKHQTYQIPNKNKSSKYEKEHSSDRPKTQPGPSKKKLPEAQNCPNFREASWIEKRREWLERHGADGLWSQCCDEKCGKWRFLVEYDDPTELPDNWYCRMNSDPYFASCRVEQEIIPRKILRELIESKYHVGSIVWARLDGYPWWPAMVEDCPDLARFCQLQGNSLIPTKYHVVFFDPKRPQRAWIPDKDLKGYRNNARETVVKKTKFRGTNFTKIIDAACAWANEALALGTLERIEKFGWTAQVSRKGRNATGDSRAKSGTPGASKKIVEKSREIVHKVGDIVWARAKGWPWWPAMIDKCPILRQHYKLPEAPGEKIEYHVVYFGEEKLEVDWCVGQSLKRFSSNSRGKSFEGTKNKRNDHIEDVNKAWDLAKTALKLPLSERLKRFDINAREKALRFQCGSSTSESSEDSISSSDENRPPTNDRGQLYNRACSPWSDVCSRLSSENSFDMSKISITISDPRSEYDDTSDESRSNETKNPKSPISFQEIDAIWKDFNSIRSDFSNDENRASNH